MSRGRKRQRSRGVLRALLKGRATRVTQLTVLVGLSMLGATTTAGQQPDGRGLIVRALQFEGNRAIDDLTLRLSIATSHSGWFARAPVIRWLGFGEKRYLNLAKFLLDPLLELQPMPAAG